MVETLRSEHFAPHTDKPVRFRGWHGTLRLVSVTQMREQPGVPAMARPPFTVLFEGPRNDVLPEGEYIADIADGPSLEFYISPIHTPAPDRQDYQAVFN
jgi:hypothetical protein